MPQVPLSAIAHGRSGDKGSHANVAVIAYTDAGFAWLRANLTAEVVAAYFRPLGASRVERFEAPNVRGLNFVLFDALAGGASRSLRTDTQGKTLAVALLRMVIEWEEPTPQPPPCREGEQHLDNPSTPPGREGANSPSLQGGGWGVGSSHE